MVYANLSLCDEHTEVMAARRAGPMLSIVKQAVEYHSPAVFPGWCYFILLPDRNVKIGYSNTERTLAERMKSLSRKYDGPVVRLAVVPGGFVTEALMHDRFRESRLPGPGERFLLTEDLAECLNVGLPADGRPPTDPPEPAEPVQRQPDTSIPLPRSGVVNY